MTAEVRETIERGEELFAAGRYRDALAIFEDVLARYPNDDGALNDAALACAEVGREAKAVTYFERALTENPANENAFYNLLDLLVRIGKADEAARSFIRWSGGVADSDEKLRYSAALAPHPAMPATASRNEVASVRRLSPADLPASGSKLKVAFICFRTDHFLRDIEHAIARRYQVQILHFDYGRVDLDRIQKLMDWADVTWFEWFDGLFVEASRRLRKTSKVICRLHRFEAFTEWPVQVSWDFVDTLVLVSPHMLDVLKTIRPDLYQRVHVEVIYNGVDLDRFRFRDRKAGFNIASVADLRSRKNPFLLLQCIDALRKEDERYVLHLAGGAKEPDAALYVDHMIELLDLHENVRRYGWVHDMDAWLEDKSYILSASLHESFGYGIAEGMARGMKPIIHHFPGAERLFPRKSLFTGIPEFVERVLEDNFDSREYRSFIERHYSLGEQVEKVSSLLLASAEHSRVAV